MFVAKQTNSPLCLPWNLFPRHVVLISQKHNNTEKTFSICFDLIMSQNLLVVLLTQLIVTSQVLNALNFTLACRKVPLS